MPAPQIEVVHPLNGEKARAVERRIDDTSAGLSAALRDSISDTMPATCGAAMLVPS